LINHQQAYTEMLSQELEKVFSTSVSEQSIFKTNVSCWCLHATYC